MGTKVSQAPSPPPCKCQFHTAVIRPRCRVYGFNRDGSRAARPLYNAGLSCATPSRE